MIIVKERAKEKEKVKPAEKPEDKSSSKVHWPPIVLAVTDHSTHK